MVFIFSGFFWSCILILLGIVIVLNIILGIHIPFFRILFALLFFYIGISILVGSSHWYHHGKNQTLFEERKIEITQPNSKQDIIFGSAEIDLTKIELNNQTQSVEVNTVFGSSRIMVNPETPMKVIISTAFSEAQMPDSNNMFFGEYTYRSKNFDETKPYLLLKLSVVFGKTELVMVGPKTEPQTKEQKKGV